MSNITENEKINSNSWHLDKRIPITLVVMIFVQTAGGVWWASKIDARMGEIEKDSLVHVTKTECADKHLILAEQVKRVEALNDTVANRLENIDRKLDRLIESTLFINHNSGN